MNRYEGVYNLSHIYDPLITLSSVQLLKLYMTSLPVDCVLQERNQSNHMCMFCRESICYMHVLRLLNLPEITSNLKVEHILRTLVS